MTNRVRLKVLRTMLNNKLKEKNNNDLYIIVNTYLIDKEKMIKKLTKIKESGLNKAFLLMNGQQLYFKNKGIFLYLSKYILIDKEKINDKDYFNLNIDEDGDYMFAYLFIDGKLDSIFFIDIKQEQMKLKKIGNAIDIYGLNKILDKNMFLSIIKEKRENNLKLNNEIKNEEENDLHQ